MKLHNKTKHFLKFHRNNPKVYALFCRITFQAMNKGLKNFGSSAVFEIIRWETSIVKNTTSQTLCNSFKPYYARLFEMQYPIHAGYFRNKLSVADELLDMPIYADGIVITPKNEQQLKFTY